MIAHIINPEQAVDYDNDDVEYDGSQIKWNVFSYTFYRYRNVVVDWLLMQTRFTRA